MNTPRTALITGATSGIGKVFAERFAAQGYDLIITGRRRDVIEAAGREISSKYGVKAAVVLAELSEEKGIAAVLKAIGKAGSIDALVNNAGFGLDKLFQDDTIENHVAMVTVHVITAIRLVHAVLPGMTARGSGIIINVASLGAYAPSPINSIYGGTKSFLNVFTESLHMEVRRSGIRVQSLCPGFTTTDFHRKMGVEDKFRKEIKRWMKPEDVVDFSLKALERGKVIVIPGLMNRFLYFLTKWVPRKMYYRIVEKAMKDYLDPGSGKD